MAPQKNKTEAFFLSCIVLLSFILKLRLFLSLSLALSPSLSVVMTGSYNNFFRMFDRAQRRDATLEASREHNLPLQLLKPRRVCTGGGGGGGGGCSKRKKDEISVDSLDFNKKILHTAWHPNDNIIAVATINNLYIFQDKVSDPDSADDLSASDMMCTI